MLNKSDFHQLDSHLVAAVSGGFLLSIEPNAAGEFSLVVYGQISTQVNTEITKKEPSDEQWVDLLAGANQIVQAMRIARSRE